jgi:DNA-binding NarL/FixJ family response regulator
VLAELKAGVSAATARLNQPPAEAELALLSLSGREREILQLIAAGKSAAEIASMVHISASTVYTHRTNMLEKLKLTTMADLVRFALETRDFFSRAS